jgi:thymidylate synthase ThyX
MMADSVSPQGIRLRTYKLRYPRIIHSEFLTHRQFSRNAGSSRAIPTKKLIEEVRDPKLRATPSFSVVNAPGMQGGRPTTPEEVEAYRSLWSRGAEEAALVAKALATMGAAKQDVNRVLEPYSHITVVVTATEFDNFFGLRLHKDAMPEIRELARDMWDVSRLSKPKMLLPGEWHLPFVGVGGKGYDYYDSIDQAIKISVARCARTSYELHDTGKRSTVEEDLKLYDKLKASGHWSPFEHQATPDKPRSAGISDWTNGWWHEDEHANFIGWRQYRKMMPGEAVAPLPGEYAS